MKLEVGKRYVRRDGTISPNLVYDIYGSEEFGEYWLFDEDTKFVYSDQEVNGNMVTPTLGEHPKDLLEEYKEK